MKGGRNVPFESIGSQRAVRSVRYVNDWPNYAQKIGISVFRWEVVTCSREGKTSVRGTRKCFIGDLTVFYVMMPVAFWGPARKGLFWML